MTAIIIIGILFAFLAAILFLPIGASISFKESFVVKIKFFSIKIYEINTDKKKETEENKSSENQKEENRETEESFFDKLKKSCGFSGAVKQIFEFSDTLLTHIKSLLRHIKINKVILNLTVASDDAATTALEYGSICAAAYPVLALLSTVANIKYKAVNINSDFNSNKPSFDFSLDIASRIFFLLITAFRCYKEYKKFTERINNNERK